MKITVEMSLSKSTQGTYVYAEPLERARSEKVFPTVYIQKHALPDPPPPIIRVTVETVNG